MSIDIPHFWKLLLESQLLSPEHCQQLGQEYGGVRGAAQQGNARTLAEWLVSRNVLSRYQTTLLLAGRAGPFVYGDFKVYDRIESGRLGGMFRAVHGVTGHPVLLSFLAGTDVADEQRWQQAAARVRQQFPVEHRHLHRCYELVDLTSFKFLVFDDLRGDALATHAAGGRFSPADAAYIVHCAALGLAELHRHGLMHGDVRPQNIWLETNGNLRLLRDILRDPQSYALSQSSPEDLAARGDYLAPEMASGDRAGDAVTDIYSLGCTFYQLLAGKPPFGGRDWREKLTHHATLPIEPLEPLGVPQPVAQIVAYMMAKNPSVRYQDVTQVAEQLMPFADPARLQSPAPAMPPSLGAFVSFVQQKQSQLAAQAPVAVAAPSFGPAQRSVANEFEFGKQKPKAGGDPDLNFGVTATPAGAVKTSEEVVEAYRRKKEKTPKEIALMLGGIAALIIAVIIGVQFIPAGDTPNNGEVAEVDSTDVKPEEEPEPDFMDVELGPIRPDYDKPVKPPVNGAETPPANAPAANPPADEPRVKVVELADDGNLLWAPPSVGEPIDFAYVPPGGQIFMIARPADMLSTPEGKQVLDSLGVQFDKIRADWEQTAGVKLEQIEQIIVSLHDNNDKLPRPVAVVQLTEPATFESLLAGWGNPAATPENASVYRVGNQSVYLPREAGGKIFVIGAENEVKEAAEFKGAAPPLRREIEKLRLLSDTGRHFTVIFAPNYLFSGGREIFTGEWKKIHEPIDQFLGDGLQAVMVSMQFDSQFYFETKLVSELGTEPGQLATNMRDRLAKIPDAMENYVVSLNPQPYWKKLALRYPQMIRYMHRFTRVGAEGDYAVINAVMPGMAAHNLVKASELALVSTPGDMTGVIASASPAAPAPSGPASLDEAMQVKLSIEIPQTSLEFAMRDLANDVRDAVPGLDKFDIVILGPDLQLNGITRNQQIRDFKVDDKPVAEILTALCMKANPVTTVKDPSEDDQKLLWVIGPDPADPSRKTILITTRESAAKKNYTLPAAFQPK